MSAEEENAIRLVALQNAQSIFLARQRAERELLEAKEALERKTQELLQEREWLRVILASIGDAVITTDIDARITFLNPIAEALTGWSATEAEGELLEKAFNIIHQETRLRAENPVGQVLREGSIVGLANHVALISRNGNETPIEDSAAPIRDAAGKTVGAVMVFHDVTEQRATERALRKSEEFNRTIIESSRDCAKTLSLDGVLLWISPVAQKILCIRDASQIIGTSWLDFWNGAEREAALLAIRAAAAGGDGNFVGWHSVQGEARCWDVVITPILDGNGKPETLLALSRDVTERSKLGEVHSRLAAVVEFSDDAIVSKTLDGIIATWNRGAERMFGYAASEVIGKSVTVLMEPDRRSEEASILAQIGRGEVIKPYETIRVRKDGTLLHVSLTVSPIKDVAGTVIGASKIARDITHHKQAEAARASAAAEIARLYRELQHANAAKDHFIAVLSHELRTPLNPVLMTVVDLENEQSIPAAIREQLTVVRRNVELEARLIDDLLDSTRIASGKLQLYRTIVDATELIRRAVAIVEGEARAKGVRLDAKICALPCPVDADPARLQQVIWNVVKNAVKFTPEGGWVRLTSEIEPPGQLRVTVEDNGIGIEPEHLGKIFNAFEQGDLRTGHRFGGLGLGLAISKALVTLHGGSILAQSKGAGFGAAFTIELPLASPPPAAPSSGRLPSASRLALRLLLVEDHEATSAVMIRLLAKRGYLVSTASSIHQAIAMLETHPIDLLISDLGLPDGSGCQIMENARLNHQLPGIALSGYGTEADVAQSSAAGFSAHLTKPVDINRLDDVIQSLFTEANPPAN